MLTLQTLQCNDPKLAQVGPGFSGFSSSSSSWTPPNSTMPARMAWQAAGSGTGSSAAPHSLRRPRLPASPLVQSIKRPATWARPRDHGTTGPRAPRVGALVGNLRWNSFSDSKIQIHKKWWFSLTFTKRTSDPLLPWGCKPQCASPSKSEHIAQCISNIYPTYCNFGPSDLTKFVTGGATAASRSSPTKAARKACSSSAPMASARRWWISWIVSIGSIGSMSISDFGRHVDTFFGAGLFCGPRGRVIYLQWVFRWPNRWHSVTIWNDARQNMTKLYKTQPSQNSSRVRVHLSSSQNWRK